MLVTLRYTAEEKRVTLVPGAGGCSLASLCALTCCSLSGQRSAFPSCVLSQNSDVVPGSRLKVVQGVGGDVPHKQVHRWACGA